MDFDPSLGGRPRSFLLTLRSKVWKAMGGSELPLVLVESPARVPIAERGVKSIVGKTEASGRFRVCSACPMVQWPRGINRVSCALFNVSIVRPLNYSCPIITRET